MAINLKRLSEEEDRILRSTLAAHPTRSERVALRCALGDASVICDLLAQTILIEHYGRNGRGATTKLGKELFTVAKRCGDAIWAVREKIDVSEVVASRPDPNAGGEG